MKDFGRSDSPAVQAQLDRLAALSLPQGRLGLATIRELMARLGDPHKRLPPVFHVAGTNGKGSTCAFLRAMLEADGKRVHVATSPHLVRYNERIRVAGDLIADDDLADLLTEVLDVGEDLAPSFFEVTIASTFLNFARTPADACVVEVGLGGRFDATNIIEHPAACGIAALGIDHERFLLVPEEGTPTSPLARIAFEKAGIIKTGCPVLTGLHPAEAQLEIERAAMTAEAPLAMRGRDWHVSATDLLHYADRHGELALPLPTLPGAHQVDNAALAVAILRHQDFVTVTARSMAAGISDATWPARLQRLENGPLAIGRKIWLDGGHNRSAGEALAAHFAGRKIHLITGMIASKDTASLIEPLSDLLETIIVVPVPHQDHHGPIAFPASATSAADVSDALNHLPNDGRPVLIAGSLYLAGEVLRANDQLPQ